MIHPNGVAVDYIWNKLVEAQFSDEAVLTMAEVGGPAFGGISLLSGTEGYIHPHVTLSLLLASRNVTEDREICMFGSQLTAQRALSRLKGRSCTVSDALGNPLDAWVMMVSGFRCLAINRRHRAREVSLSPHIQRTRHSWQRWGCKGSHAEPMRGNN